MFESCLGHLVVTCFISVGLSFPIYETVIIVPTSLGYLRVKCISVCKMPGAE